MISQRRASKDGGAQASAVRHSQRRRGLRIGMAAAALLAALPQGRAAAADWPDLPLRGTISSPGPVRWDGFHLGGQMGLANMGTDFGSSTSQQVAYILRNSTLESEAQPSAWAALPHSSTNTRSYGGFLGYSTQQEQLIIGFDAAYNRVSSAQIGASDSMTRVVTTTDSVQHTVMLSAQSSTKLIDYATARFRFGYAMAQFLPYVFIGGSVGRFDYSNSSTVRDSQLAGGVTTVFGPVTMSDAKANAIVGGFTTGVGIDVALMPNLFLRGEFEYVGFAPIGGIRSSINTGRVAIGMRF
jgi:opacity protein-like surface antigen